MKDLQRDLETLWRGLEWASARRDWRDGVAERFEREFWNKLEDEVPKLVRAIAALDHDFQQTLSRLEN